MSDAIVVRTPAQLVEQPTPATILQLAVAQGASIDTIERLVALQKQMLDRQAEIEFNEALNQCQQECTPVAVDLENPQTRSKYASYKALDQRIRPLYSKHGFSISFNTGESDKPEHVRVFAYLSRGSHTRTYQTDMPADGKGAKGGDVMTKTHAAGAAMSYGMRYLLKMIFNLAIGEDDRDGNEVGMDDMLLTDWLDGIKQARTTSELQGHYAKAFKAAFDAKDRSAQERIIAAKNARYKELTK